MHNLPEVRDEAERMIASHDGHAHRIVDRRVDAKLEQGDVSGALQADQLRREIMRVYEETGEEPA